VQEEGKEMVILKDKVAPFHLEVSDTINPTNLTESDYLSSQSSTKGSMCNHEVNIGSGTPDIMVKTFCKRYLRKNNLDPTLPRTVREAAFDKKLRTVMIIKLKDDYLVSQISFPFKVSINGKFEFHGLYV
jgi:hypothetical protein